MYRFLMCHAYHGFSGIFSIVVRAALLIYYAAAMGDDGTGRGDEPDRVERGEEAA